MPLGLLLRAIIDLKSGYGYLQRISSFGLILLFNLGRPYSKNNPKK